MRKSKCRGAFSIALIVAGCLSSLLVYGQTATSKRDVQAVSSLPTSSLQPGPYYALVIGNQNYRHLNKLQTPISDAKAVEQLLRERYGFHTKLLIDADRDQILTAMVEYRRMLPENSNLLIYYAGHGHHDPDTNRAYWLPVDAETDNNARWIIADDITSDVRAMRSSHVLVISDSCYSGYLTRAADAAIEPTNPGVYLAKALKSKSRTLMSSGGDEPVADSGAPGHSVFAGVILDSLREMEEDNFTAAYLVERFIKPRVGGRSDQLPQYSVILNSGHDGGDFVFSRQPVGKAPTSSVEAATANPPRASGKSDVAAVGALPPGSVEAATANPPRASGKSDVAAVGALPPGMDPTLADLYRRAEAGNNQAMFELGWDYEGGKGVPKDQRQAVVWYRKAAEAGNNKAMTNLGDLYNEGHGVPQDAQKAKEWYEKGAAAGNADAMNSLGGYYGQGVGVPKDYQKAKEWYEKGAAAGNSNAMYNLGYLYALGYGVRQDYQKARKWLEKSAAAGNSNAMYNLSILYEQGLGGPKDDEKALDWCLKAAAAGNPDAQQALKTQKEKFLQQVR